jgi:hypothetical protein
MQGDYARMRSLYERSLALYEELNKPNWVATVISCLGSLARAEGDLLRARYLLEQTVAIQRRLDDKVGLSFALVNLGMVLIHFGELERSEELFQEGLAIQLELGGSWLFMDLMAFGFLANAKGQPLRAVRLLAAWDAIGKAAGKGLEHDDQRDYESNLATLHAQLDEATFEAAWAEGAALTLEQAVELALSDAS